MTTWTVGEGRSSPQTLTAARLAAEDAQRDAWLSDRLKAEYRPPPRERTHCPEGHPLEGKKKRNGKEVRYCRICNRNRMAKARAG